MTFSHSHRDDKAYSFGCQHSELRQNKEGIVDSKIVLPGEYREEMKGRYSSASTSRKSELLDEFVKGTDYHRKPAARALRGVEDRTVSKKRGRPAVYGAELRVALRVVWEASDRLCGKRLAPFAGELADRMVEHGELSVSAEFREQL